MGKNIDELTIGEAKRKIAEAEELRCAIKNAQPAKDCCDDLETKRVILVVDRGWIFAGDQSLTDDGYIRLENAIHVFRWESIGFAAMVKDWKNSKVDLRPVDDVEVPRDSVIFRIPVPPLWGIK